MKLFLKTTVLAVLTSMNNVEARLGRNLQEAATVAPTEMATMDTTMDSSMGSSMDSSMDMTYEAPGPMTHPATPLQEICFRGVEDLSACEETCSPAACCFMDDEGASCGDDIMCTEWSACTWVYPDVLVERIIGPFD